MGKSRNISQIPFCRQFVAMLRRTVGNSHFSSIAFYLHDLTSITVLPLASIFASITWELWKHTPGRHIAELQAGSVYEALGILLSVIFEWMQRFKCISSSLFIQGRISSWLISRAFVDPKGKMTKLCPQS